MYGIPVDAVVAKHTISLLFTERPWFLAALVDHVYLMLGVSTDLELTDAVLAPVFGYLGRTCFDVFYDGIEFDKRFFGYEVRWVGFQLLDNHRIDVPHYCGAQFRPELLMRG